MSAANIGLPDFDLIEFDVETTDIQHLNEIFATDPNERHEREVAEVHAPAIEEAPKYLPTYINVAKASIILQTMASKRGETFNPTILTDDDLANNQQRIVDYFTNIKTVCKTEGKTTDKTFIIAGEHHWSCCQVRCCLVNNEPFIKIFLLDTVFLRAHSYLKDTLCCLAECVFKDQLKRFESDVVLQRDVSCKIFSLMHARMFHSLLYGKFKHIYNYDLWYELEQSRVRREHIIHGGLINAVQLPAKLQQANQTHGLHGLDFVLQPTEPVKSTGKTLSEALNENYKLLLVNGELKFKNLKIQAESEKFKSYIESNESTVVPAEKYTITGLLPASETPEPKVEEPQVKRMKPTPS